MTPIFEAPIPRNREAFLSRFAAKRLVSRNAPGKSWPNAGMAGTRRERVGKTLEWSERAGKELEK
ncbi:MAG: hypothetical protein IJF17_08740 [Thermoguttaceae bacterium]|nr:hypothetical protein [Thermoguttaceae bacterium]